MATPPKIIKIESPPSIPVSQLKKWNLFKSLDPTYLEKVRLAYVGGDPKQKGLQTGFLITVDDTVYSVGSNSCRSLGVDVSKTCHGKCSYVEDPVLVSPLTGQRVKEIYSLSFTGGHACPKEGAASLIWFGLTEDGRVFHWGHDWMRTPDDPMSDDEHGYYPSKLGLEDLEKVKQLLVTKTHAFALLETGVLMKYKRNDVVRNFEVVRCRWGEEKVRQIAATEVELFVITEKGDLYEFLSTTENFVLIRKEQVDRIIAGPNHLICLRRHEYPLLAIGYGDNKFGEWGSGPSTAGANRDGARNIHRVQSMKKTDVLDVGIVGRTSFCKSENGCFIWGHHLGAKLYQPRSAPGSTTLHDLAAHHTIPQLMHASLIATDDDQEVPGHNESFAEILSQAFLAQDVDSTLDVTFEVEEQTVKAHKHMLKVKSEYFRKMFAEHWTEREGNVKIQNVSFPVFHALLYYIYAGKIAFPYHDTANISELLRVADQYLEDKLKRKCEILLTTGMNLKNVVSLYEVASSTNSEELQSIARTYIVDHFAQINAHQSLIESSLDREDFFLIAQEFARRHPSQTSESEDEGDFSSDDSRESDDDDGRTIVIN